MFFFFKQKTAYEMRISDWSSDVCSSDLRPLPPRGDRSDGLRLLFSLTGRLRGSSGRNLSISCREKHMPVTRRDFKLRTVDGVTIGVREVKGDGPGANSGTPIVLLHGTRIPGISEYDLPVPNGSLAQDLALAGHPCFIPDARGFGRSE